MNKSILFTGAMSLAGLAAGVALIANAQTPLVQKTNTGTGSSGSPSSLVTNVQGTNTSNSTVGTDIPEGPNDPVDSNSQVGADVQEGPNDQVDSSATKQTSVSNAQDSKQEIGNDADGSPQQETAETGSAPDTSEQ